MSCLPTHSSVMPFPRHRGHVQADEQVGMRAGERTEWVGERANEWAGVAADGKGYLDLRLQVWCHELVRMLAFLSISRCRLADRGTM